MRTRLTRTSLLKAALLALFINGSVLAQNGPGGTFSGRITGLTNSGSDVGAANGLSTADGVPLHFTARCNKTTFICLNSLLEQI
jgi:hypothetical protein